MAWTNGVYPAASWQIYKEPSTYLDESPFKRKMDVGIMGRYGNKDDEVDEKTRPKSNWAQILVIGNLNCNSIEDGQEPAWLDLATYALPDQHECSEFRVTRSYFLSPPAKKALNFTGAMHRERG
jgi:hypothetical protein